MNTVLVFNARFDGWLLCFNSYSASAQRFLFAFAVLSAWLLQLRRVQRSSIHLLRGNFVDGFGKCQLDFRRGSVSFWQLSEYLLQFSASLVRELWLRGDLALVERTARIASTPPLPLLPVAPAPLGG